MRATAQSENRGKCYASAGKKAAGGTSPSAPSSKTTNSGTQRSLGGRLPQPSATCGSGVHGPTALDGNGQFWRPGPMLWIPVPIRIQPLLTWRSRVGHESTWRVGLKGSGEASGLEGTEDASPRADPVGGSPGARPHDPGQAGDIARDGHPGTGLRRPAGHRERGREEKWAAPPP